MDKEKISVRQLLALLTAALLCPAVRVLPVQTAGTGRGGWLSALAALPVLLIACWVLSRLLDQGGLSEALRRTLGTGAGTAAAGVYLIWGVLLLCVDLRLFGLRVLSAGYRNGPMPLFMAALLGLALWLVRKRGNGLFRAGQVFYLALALGLGAVLVLGCVQVEPANVLPVWTGDLPDIAIGAVPVLALLGYGVYGGFFGGQVARRPEDRRHIIGWAVGLCLALTALQWVCLGTFGPGLTARMESPFFMMVKGVGIEGAFERVEAVVIALWVFADLALLALLLGACCHIIEDIFPVKEGERAALPLAVLVLAGSIGLFPDAFVLEQWISKVVLPGNLILGLGVPGAAALAGWARKKL